MKPNLVLGLLALCVTTAGASSQKPRSANDLCYLQCQYECYIQFPGGGEQWRQCYVACGATRCSAA